ncbi:alpha/beta fold hydrolase [Ammoniphilus sp. 3BR4]|uniref:alpha/beta fold hydrolase n=1 Tax=Ammoniphilus sp. 3BR4 TaxID=3158265 RepID=UPI003466A7EB
MEAKRIKTDRLEVAYLEAGDPARPVVMLVHGNVSSSWFWEDMMESLSQDFYVLAPDLRGYGETEPLAIDATRGLRDWSEDVRSFVQSLRLDRQLHMLGWSMGGGVVMQYAIDYPNEVSSLMLMNPVSPFGFGGTKDEQGTPCYPNFAGSGGGTANPQFIELLSQRATGEEQPHSPRNVLNQFYVKPPFRLDAQKEDRFVRSMLSTKLGSGFYPGTFETCAEWPGVAPGDKGINNALSPKYLNLAAFADLEPQIPVLWIRGADDQIVSDSSLFDFGYLGKLGYVPGWPGMDEFPPQPMVSQMRVVLERSGNFEEWVVENTGHSPHLEKRDFFLEKIRGFIKRTM